MKPTPKDWPRMSIRLSIRRGCRHRLAMGYLRLLGSLKVEGDQGRIEHSELTYGEGLIMVAQETPQSPRPWKSTMRSPRSLDGAVTQSIMFFVDDAEAHCAHARARGARIVEELATHDYGADYWSDRSYGALDPEGHVWWVTQRLRDPPAT